MQEGGSGEKLRGITGQTEKLLKKYFGKYIFGEEKEFQINIKKQINSVTTGIIYGIVAFIIAGARLGNGIYPFGIALLCASEKKLQFILAGLIASSFFSAQNIVVNILAYFTAYIIREIICRNFGLKNGKAASFNEPYTLRMATAALAAFIIGMYGIIDSGFTKSALRSAVAIIVLSPTAAFLFGGVSVKQEKVQIRRDLGILSIMFSCVLALKNISAVGISPAVIISSFLTLCSAVSGSMLKGCLVGTVCGLACGVHISPMLGIAGAAAGALKQAGTVVPMLAFCGTGIVFSFVSEGLASMGGTIPAMLWGGAFFTPIAKLGLLPKIYSVFTLSDGYRALSKERETKILIADKQMCDTEKKIFAISEALQSLSSVFYTLSNRISTPGIYEVRILCEKSFKIYCKKCQQFSFCWDKNYERTSDIMNKLANAVAKNGCADSDFIPGDFFKTCPNAIKAISELNLSHARMLEDAARTNKTEVFALDYEDMAKLLELTAEEAAEEYECDEILSDEVRKAAREMKLFFTGLAVFGKRRKTLVAGGVDISSVSLSSSEICSKFEESCGIKLTVPEFTIDGDYVTMTARSARRISVECERSSLKKENETVNGDSAASFFNKEDYFYSIISDGMGSGVDAAMTSRTTCIFLEKMLSAGNRKNVVLKMLNNFIRHKNLECFATVDMLEIDLLNSTAIFIKSGAAASYIIRDKKLFKIASNSLPIGITRRINAEEIKFELKANDLIVMISDGISQSFEDGVWLAGLLSSEIDPAGDLGEISGIILEAARVNNKRSDDMTVSVIRIRDN